MTSVRLRRLQSDYERLLSFLKRQPRLRLIQSEGQPPERYQLEYNVRGLRQVDDQLQVVNRHLVEIFLPRNYPRTPPQCRMLTPVFHPNIAPHAICIGDHWGAGEPLWAMVARIGEMIACQSYNTKSPLNGEAARWVDENEDRLPLDAVAMYVEEPEAAPAASPAKEPIPVARLVPKPAPPAGLTKSPRSGVPPAATGGPRPAPQPPRPARASLRQAQTQPASPPDKIAVACPGCGARYQVRAQLAGKTAQCAQCRAAIRIPSRPGEP